MRQANKTNPIIAEYVIPGMTKTVIIHSLIYKLLCFFDYPPAFSDNLETTEQYVMRVKKKYALRQLNLSINTLPSFDIKKINDVLAKTSKKEDGDYYEFFKRLFIKRTKLMLLRQQIINQ